MVSRSLAFPNSLPCPRWSKTALTFEANARKKAEQYSRYVPGEIVVADDSGLEIDALNGAPACTPPAMPRLICI